MRPLKLEIQAFGPFAGTQTLDFDELGERSLFLIHGPTGAGKTTVLDAICFALFGESSGDERDSKQLRSDFADAGLPTQVSFTFRHGDKRYCVTRRPEQQLAKKRGEGLTKKAPEAELVLLAENADEKNEVKAAKTTECTRAIVDLLGLDASQFRQVILIPQGQFRQFLLAGTDEREKIFQTLFRTGHYRAIQDRLKAQARDIGEQVKENRLRHETLLQQSESENSAALDTAIAGIDTELAALTKQQKSAATELAKTGERRAAFDRLLETVERRDTNRRQQQAATTTLAEGEAAAKQAATDLSADEKREPERAAWREQRTRLQELAPQLAKFQTAVDQAAAAEKKLTALQTTIAAQAKRTDEQEALGKTLAEQIAKLRTTAAEAEGRRLKRDQAAERLEQRRQLDQVAAQHQKAQQQTTATEADGKACKGAVEAAKKHHAALLQQRHDARAASLADELVADQPCPVCGSPDHPAPAASDATIPDDDAIDAAEAAIRTAEKAVDRARDRWRADHGKSTELKTRLDTLGEQLGDDSKADPADLAKRLAEAEKLARAAGEAAEALARTEKNQRETVDAIEQLKRERQRAEGELAGARTDRDSGAARRDQLAEQIAAPLREPGQLQRELAALEQKISAADKQLAELRERKSQADTALAGARSRLAEVTKAGTALDEELSTQRGAFAEDLKDLVPADDTPLENEVIAPFREQLVAAESAASLEADRLNTAAGALRHRLETRRKERKQIGKLDREFEELEAEFRVSGKLAEVANGTGANTRRITFQRFVLGALLDDVLSSASHRLSAMSRGRYQMYRSRDNRRGGGLDLEVLDHHSGVARPVATLSGGESFLASLSLALGLADVTEAYAGGVRMETMFIDEGFGTLDSEALDLAFKTLYDLQEGGRLVGVISHVAELRERIDARLEVSPQERGSSAKFVV